MDQFNDNAKAHLQSQAIDPTTIQSFLTLISQLVPYGVQLANLIINLINHRAPTPPAPSST